MGLVFTDAAAAKVKELIDEEGNPALKLRVFVQGGGCSGFQYGFTFDEDVNEDDTQLDKNGVYEHNEAIQILDAWWPKLVTAQFQSGLGDAAFAEIQNMIAFGAVTSRPSAPGFADGWWGYSLQDLQRLQTGADVPGGFPVTFCGNGDKTACSTALQDSLKQALTVTPEQLYAFGACATDPQPSCWNANRARVTAGVTKPNVYPFQNRPTFQQAVSVGK